MANKKTAKQKMVVVRLPVDSEELGLALVELMAGAIFSPILGSAPLHEVALPVGWAVDAQFAKATGWSYVVNPQGKYVVQFAYSNRGPRPSGAVNLDFRDPRPQQS